MSQDPESIPPGTSPIGELRWLRYQIISLCEAAEDGADYRIERATTDHERGFYRGSASEAKGIRQAIAEVVRCRIKEIEGGSSDTPSVDSAQRTAGVLWSAWPEDDCDSDPRIDPMSQKVTEWFVGQWPSGADEPECRILIGTGRSAELIARRIAENLTRILSTDAILTHRTTPAFLTSQEP